MSDTHAIGLLISLIQAHKVSFFAFLNYKYNSNVLLALENGKLPLLDHTAALSMPEEQDLVTLR